MFAVETYKNPLTNPDDFLLIMGLLVPFVTAILAKWHAPDAVKGLITISVSALGAFLKKYADDGALTWSVFLNGFIQVWITALVSWLGLTSDWVAKLNQLTGRFGIGGSSEIVPIKITPPPPPPTE